jgi:hypothetical protein
MASYKTVALAALMGLSLLSTAASADADKGQRIYMKKLKSECGMSGGVFAAKNDQATWEEAKENGTLGEAMTKICPAGKEFFESDKFKDKFSSDLYDFVNKFASDSGNIPSC